jgi:hypothetical protein
MYLGQATGTPIITGLTQLVQAGGQLYQQLQPRPAGVTPTNYGVMPQYRMPESQLPQGIFGTGLDPMTLALIVGGGVLIFVLARRK